MKAKIAHYLNDIISLVVMGLMITALVAAQAAEVPEQTGHAFQDVDDRILLAELRVTDDELVLSVDF